MKIVAFFNNKGGVGKTTLVYHLASIFADRGLRTLVVDLDPQANVTSMCLEEERLEVVWPDKAEHEDTIYGVLRPIIRGIGDIADPHVEPVRERLGLIIGDLALSTFEDKLSDAWPRCHNRDESAFRTMTAFYRTTCRAAEDFGADLVLVDVGPNLGAINRAALIASDYVVIPLGPDLFSLQGLRNLGPSLSSWRLSWQELIAKSPDPGLPLPGGEMEPIGYVVMQHGMRENRPPKAYQRWINRFPAAYRRDVLKEDDTVEVPAVADDPNCLATLKHYRSLMPMAMEARKPVFFLRPADGAIGAHVEAVRAAYQDFHQLARRIGERCGLIVG
ncbi:MAG: AAA family ATPase [Gammaproteobacteria bacterium]